MREVSKTPQSTQTIESVALPVLPPSSPEALARKLINTINEALRFPEIAKDLRKALPDFQALESIRDKTITSDLRESSTELTTLLELSRELVPALTRALWKQHLVEIPHVNNPAQDCIGKAVGDSAGNIHWISVNSNSINLSTGEPLTPGGIQIGHLDTELSSASGAHTFILSFQDEGSTTGLPLFNIKTGERFLIPGVQANHLSKVSFQFSPTREEGYVVVEFNPTPERQGDIALLELFSREIIRLPSQVQDPLNSKSGPIPSPIFSPDGSQVYYPALVHDEWQLFDVRSQQMVRRANGQAVRQLAPPIPIFGRVPQDTFVVFQDGTTLKRLNLADKSESRITNVPIAALHGTSCFPDGNQAYGLVTRSTPLWSSLLPAFLKPARLKNAPPLRELLNLYTGEFVSLPGTFPANITLPALCSNPTLAFTLVKIDDTWLAANISSRELIPLPADYQPPLHSTKGMPIQTSMDGSIALVHVRTPEYGPRMPYGGLIADNLYDLHKRTLVFDPSTGFTRLDDPIVWSADRMHGFVMRASLLPREVEIKNLATGLTVQIPDGFWALNPMHRLGHDSVVLHLLSKECKLYLYDLSGEIIRDLNLHLAAQRSAK